MPEALARADYDFTLSEEPPRRRARADRIEPSVSRVPPMRDGQGAASGALRFAGSLARRPLRTLVILASAAIAVSFTSNLLFMQEGPHPAPLFAKVEPRASADARPVRVETPAPQRSAAAAPPPSGIQPAPAPVAAPTAPAAARSAPPAIAPTPPARPVETTRAEKPAEKPDFDPIAQFLRTGVAPPPSTTASTNSADARRVSAAQRALAKLGYKVDADGVMGPGTRAAIERFERESKIQVTGDLNPRTVRLLSARASIPIP